MAAIALAPVRTLGHVKTWCSTTAWGSARWQRGVATAIAGVIFWPQASADAVVGLDTSWQAGLALAPINHLAWGREIVFTYGPLGFLQNTAYYSFDQSVLATVYQLITVGALFLGIAAALLGDPGVLIFDEPLNGLDPDGIRWLRGLLRSLAGEGRTVFLSSHLLTEVAQTVDDVIVLSRGRLVTQTTLADLVARTSVVRVRTPEAARLLDMLVAAGLRVRLVDATTAEVRSATADAVGVAAAAAGVTILELSRHDEDLESLFFELVGQDPQNQEVAA